MLNNTYRKKEQHEKADNMCKFTQEDLSSEEQMHIW